MPSIEVCDVKDWVQFVVLIGVMVLEAWLGRTAVLKSGSILELIINLMVRIIKPLITKKPQGGNVDSKKTMETAAAAKAQVPMTKAYDLKVLGARLKEAGLGNAEQLAGEVYLVTKDWAKESAPLSENKIDDLAAPFYDQADTFVLSQLDKIDQD